MMRKLVLSLALLALFTSAALAQTERGNIMVGGQLGYESSKDEDTDTYESKRFSIIPNVGYFFSDRMVIGTGMGYEKIEDYSNNDWGWSSSTAKAFIVSPFGRYYFPISDKFQFFGQLSCLLENRKAKPKKLLPSFHRHAAHLE